MKNARNFSVVLLTAPDPKVARRLARGALKRRLIACANLVPRIESHYWWQGKLETGKEVMLLMKTTKLRLTALEKFIADEHPYDTPELLVLRIDAGARQYLDWLAGSVQHNEAC